MAYIEQDYRLDYFAFNEWVDTPASMLQPLLMRALVGTGRFGAATDDARGVRPNLRLDSQVVEVHQDFRHRPSLGSVSIRVQLVDPEHQRIMASRSFRATEHAATDDPYGGVVAVNRALTRLLPEIAAFVASRGRGANEPFLGAER
jgi:cholesterol transport system auxiliary component